MWDVYVEDGQIFVIDGDVTVCEIADHDNYTNPAPDGMKNAHLLAAAPELLAALHNILSLREDENPSVVRVAYKIASVAIAKAEGGLQ